jgi:hypothetical protein
MFPPPLWDDFPPKLCLLVLHGNANKESRCYFGGKIEMRCTELLPEQITGIPNIANQNSD